MAGRSILEIAFTSMGNAIQNAFNLLVYVSKYGTPPLTPDVQSTGFPGEYLILMKELDYPPIPPEM